MRDGALQDPKVAPRFLGRMETEVDALTQMAQELLELSRIESGQSLLEFTRVNSAALLESSAERMRAQVERAGLELKVEFPEDLPAIRADAARMEQVLVNLIHNAVKFTRPGGEVTLSARAEGTFVRFSVRTPAPASLKMNWGASSSVSTRPIGLVRAAAPGWDYPLPGISSRPMGGASGLRASKAGGALSISPSRRVNQTITCLNRLLNSTGTIMADRKIRNYVMEAAMKTKVLFLCTGNSARSQMAEAFLRRLGGEQFEASSAGLEPKGLHPLTVQVMAEIGYDLSGHRSKSVDEFLGGQHFNFIITVCDDADKNCPRSGLECTNACTGRLRIRPASPGQN